MGWIGQSWANLHRKQFEGFHEKYMNYADVYSMDELAALNQSTDAFVCGSDVIWSPDFNFDLGAYYLDFAKKYAFSYAPSFGKCDIGEQELSQVKDWISRLNGVSVREHSSAATANRILDKNVPVVADPVLLLNCEEWDKVAELPRKTAGKPYIFAYSTHLTPEYQQFLKQLQKQTGFKVVRSTWKPRNAMKQGFIQVQTPPRWLQLLRDAAFVVTNSFHGTVFSVLYHKAFFTVVQGNKGGGSNIRMNDFLSALELGDRMYSSVPNHIDTSTPSYEGVDNMVTCMREDSMDYLRKNLEAAYQQKIQLEQKHQASMAEV